MDAGKLKIIVAAIGAGGLVLVALISTFGPAVLPSRGGTSTATPSTVALKVQIKDSKCDRPLAATVRIEKLDGTAVDAPQQSDVNGEATVQAPSTVAEVFIIASATGHSDYKQKVPAVAGKHEVRLEPLPIRRGIPDGASLDEILKTLSGDLQVTIAFTPSCSARARKAVLAGGSISGYRCTPTDYINQSLARVNGRPASYRVNEITPFQRYEVDCF